MPSELHFSTCWFVNQVIHVATAVISLLGATNANHELVRKIFSLDQLLTSRGCRLRVRLIPSHVGSPPNEEADRLALAALSLSTPTLNVPHR